jgi:methylated-DNA-[protein]-cysteine S-methyltransferase
MRWRGAARCGGIVYQQLSGKAAATIHARVHALLRRARRRGRAGRPAPGRGPVAPKLRYLKDLARRAASGRLPRDALGECRALR